MAKKRRKSDDNYRFQAPSIPELVLGLSQICAESNLRGVRHFGRKLGEGPTLNALIAVLIKEVPLDQLVEMVRRGNGYYEDLLSRDPAESSYSTGPLPLASPAHTTSQPDRSVRQAPPLDPATGEPFPMKAKRGKSA